MTQTGEPEWLAANRTAWDDRVPVHLASRFYDVDGFVAGRTSLEGFELAELGQVVPGQSLVHLQCHFGLDTLSWAREGARVTGLDFSGAAIAAARALAERVGVDASWVEGDVHDAPALLGRQFDVVYTGKGALNWLPDITSWAEVVAACCKPGGLLYLSEFHPLTWIFADETMNVEFDYFTRGKPMVTDEPGTYAEPTATFAHNRMFEWHHQLGEVVSALVKAGLALRFLHEHPSTCFQQWPFLVEEADRTWVMPRDRPSLPLMYSLLMTKS